MYLRKVQAFDDPDACLKQSMVGLDSILAEATDREVIDADCLYLLCREVECSFVRDVDEIFNEVICLPAPARVPRLEEHSFAELNLLWVQVAGFDRFGVMNLNHTRPSNGSGEWHCIDALACSKEVDWGVHMRPGMRS